MAQKIGDAFVEISARLNKFNKQIATAGKKVETSFQKVNKKLDGSFNRLGATIAGAFAVQKIAQFTAEAVKLASVTEGVKRAFERLNDPMLLDNLKKATRGTVSELELMQAAVNAKNLGVPVKNLASLFAFATQRAADTGEAVDYLVQSIVTGIGRKSPLILDNLGISAIDLKAQLNGVGLEAASVGDIAEAVGRIASKSMADIGETSLTSAQKIAVMNARITELQTELGKDVTPAYLFILETLDSAFDGLTATLGNGKKVWQDFLKLIGKQAESTEISRRNQLNLNKAFAAGLFNTRQYIDANGNLSESQIKVLNENYKLLTSFTSVTDAEKYLSGQASKTTKDLKEQTIAVDELSKKFNEAAFDIAGANNQFNAGRGGATGELEEVPEFLEEGEGFGDTKANLEEIALGYDRLAESINFAGGIATGFGQAINDSLVNSLNGAGNFFAQMGEWLKQLIIKLAAAALAAFAVKAILSSFTGGAALLGDLGGFSGLFSSFSGFGGGQGTNGFQLRGDLLNSATGRANNNQNRALGIGG